MEALQLNKKKLDAISRLLDFIFPSFKSKYQNQIELTKFIFTKLALNKKVYSKEIWDHARNLSKSGNKAKGGYIVNKVLYKLHRLNILERHKDANGVYYQINTYGFKSYLQNVYNALIALTK